MGDGVNMSVRKVKDFQMPRSTIKVLKVLEVGLFCVQLCIYCQTVNCVCTPMYILLNQDWQVLPFKLKGSKSVRLMARSLIIGWHNLLSNVPLKLYFISIWYSIIGLQSFIIYVLCAEDKRKLNNKLY